MQPTRTILTILLEGHLIIIAMNKYRLGQNVLGREVVWIFSFTIWSEHYGGANFDPSTEA